MATPERASGWLNTLLPVLERSGPLAAIILGLCAYYVISGQQQELERAHGVSRELFSKLEASYVAQIALARDCPPEGEKP